MVQFDLAKVLILIASICPVVCVSALMSDGQTINGVTFNQPWYEVKNEVGDATIFLIDTNGDMYVDADSINVSSTITGPFVNSLIIQDVTDEIFVINAAHAYFSGKIYPNYASLPAMNGNDMVIQNGAGTPVAIFDGDDNSLYLAGDATYDAVDLESNNALAFDGTDDYIQLPAMNPDYSAGITLEAWVNWSDTGAYDRIIELGNGMFANTIMLGNANTDDNLRLATYDGSWTNVYAYNYIEIGKWIHVAASIAANNSAVLYKNGIAVATGTVILPTTTNRTSSRIGFGNWATDAKFMGKLDNVRIWNDVRTESEIKADMFSTYGTMLDNANLVAYWDFNEILGSQLIDQHSGNYHATLQGEMNSDDWVSSYTERTLTITSGGNGTPSPNGSQTIADGQSFPVIATPASGFAFDSWVKTAGSGGVSFSEATNDTTWVTVTGGDAEIQGSFVDAEAPTVPTGMWTITHTNTNLEYVFNTSTDNVGIAGYKVYLNGSVADTVYTGNYTALGLGVTKFTVSAFDAAGNESAQSKPLYHFEMESNGFSSGLVWYGTGYTYAGNITDGDYANFYSVTLDAGNYIMKVRLADNGDGSQVTETQFLWLGVYYKTLTHQSNTGGWESWETHDSGSFTIPSGTGIVLIQFYKYDFNVDWVELIPQ
ncbi:MAG: DUF5010 C-terminal domain-containing protein [Reichenbachiella sp.]